MRRPTSEIAKTASLRGFAGGHVMREPEKYCRSIRHNVRDEWMEVVCMRRAGEKPRSSTWRWCQQCGHQDKQRDSNRSAREDANTEHDWNFEQLRRPHSHFGDKP